MKSFFKPELRELKVSLVSDHLLHCDSGTYVFMNKVTYSSVVLASFTIFVPEVIPSFSFDFAHEHAQLSIDEKPSYVFIL